MELKPHKFKYWLNSPLKKTPEFRKAAKEVCELYRQAPELHLQKTHIVSCDEKTGIQALEKLYHTKGALPGGCNLQEFEYIRHGTLCLMANFEVATGHIIAPSIGPTRKEKDFLEHIKQTVFLDPNGRWIFIVDNCVYSRS